MWVPEALQLGNQRSPRDLSFFDGPDIKNEALDPTIEVSGPNSGPTGWGPTCWLIEVSEPKSKHF